MHNTFIVVFGYFLLLQTVFEQIFYIIAIKKIIFLFLEQTNITAFNLFRVYTHTYVSICVVVYVDSSKIFLKSIQCIFLVTKN